MSKLFAIVAGLKAILIAASVALARGDMLSVILISVLFNLAELGGKPVGRTVPRDSMAVSPSDVRGRCFEIHADSALVSAARSIRKKRTVFVSFLA
jgi:hypothetical protein